MDADGPGRRRLPAAGAEPEARSGQGQEGLSGACSTIYAPATAPGRAAVGVLRVSGPAAAAACRRLTGRDPPTSRRAALRRLREPTSGAAIDEALVLWFPGPHSATGEDLLELHHHGGRAVLDGLLAVLAAMPELRLAEPGEFTRRAFLAGKLDLTQAEAIADLVDATTRAQARQALRQLDGALGAACARWREAIVGALALVEAEIDFAAEEGDVADDLLMPARADLARIAAELEEAERRSRAGERLREGLVVAVVGPPNAGKSSLVNLLARREVAIVTPHPGTTRDVIEVAIDLGGVPVTLLDTAGLRDSDDPIESAGIARARRWAATADAVVAVVAADDLTRSIASVPERADVLVVNKVDLVAACPSVAFRGPVIGASCRTGDGIDRLTRELARVAGALAVVGGDAVFTRERHREALRGCRAALERVLAAPAGCEVAVLAEELRLASRALGRLTGAVDVEDVLDRVFASFCIGK